VLSREEGILAGRLIASSIVFPTVQKYRKSSTFDQEIPMSRAAGYQVSNQQQNLVHEHLDGSGAVIVVEFLKYAGKIPAVLRR
jgi:hypothetical protein